MKFLSAISMDLPIQIDFQILQLAKLRMFEFAYDFIVKYIPRTNFQFLQTDTDSLYIALSKTSLKDSVYEHLLPEIIDQTENRCGDIGRCENAFLPRTCCDEHAFEDSLEYSRLNFKVAKCFAYRPKPM